MSQDDRRVEINISGIPVAGVGGLGLVAMAVWVSVVMPELRGTLVAGLSGGAVLAIALIVARRHIKSSGPSGTDPKILFRPVPSEDPSHSIRTGGHDSPESRLSESTIYATP
jgi:hypothetical protein